MTLDDRGPELVASTIALLALSVISVALRSYVKIVLLKAFRTEDWLALVTLVRHDNVVLYMRSN